MNSPGSDGWNLDPVGSWISFQESSMLRIC